MYVIKYKSGKEDMAISDEVKGGKGRGISEKVFEGGKKKENEEIEEDW